MSNFFEWDQRKHAEDWILFPDNIGESLSIDETSLSQGELYTVVTNKAAQGKKGALVAMVKGTESEKVRGVLEKISLRKRKQVKEVTLDMAASMERIARFSFPQATLVTDRFHVQKLAYDAVQEMRIKYRWEAIDQENKEIELSKETRQRYVAEILENGDTVKQLLARSRFLLFKPQSKWTPSQWHRGELLFTRYPKLEEAYYLSLQLGNIYHRCKDKGIAFTKLAQWYNRIDEAGFESFKIVARSIEAHYKNILNYFDNRSTNG